MFGEGGGAGDERVVQGLWREKTIKIRNVMIEVVRVYSSTQRTHTPRVQMTELAFFHNSKNN